MKNKLISLKTCGSEIRGELHWGELLLGEKEIPMIRALALADPLDFFSHYQSILSSGDIPLILNPALPENKVREIAEKMSAHSLITNEGEQSLAGQARGISKTHILFSSGTTSPTMIGKHFVFHIEDAFRNGAAHLQSLDIYSAQKILLPLPLTHSFGLVAGVLASLKGGHDLYVLPPSVGAASILAAVKNFKIDHLYLTPSLLKMMVKFLGRGKITTPALRSISIGSALLLKRDLLELMSFFPHTQFYFTYGLTEMGPRAFSFKAGNVSDPHPALLTDSGPVPIGEVIAGIEYKIEREELFIKSPYQALNLPQGFYATKDRAQRGQAGVEVLGRMDSTIIRGGVNIYPHEIEALLLDYPGIKEAVVIALSSPTYGQVPVLVVQVEKRDEGWGINLRDFLKTHLPASHLPSRIVQRTQDFPRSAMGKIKTVSLVDEINNE